MTGALRDRIGKNMNSTYIIFGAAVAVSFGAGWMLKPTPDVQPTAVTSSEASKNDKQSRPSNLGGAQSSESKAKSPRKSVSQTTGEAGDETATPKDAEREKRRADFRKQMGNRMIDRQKKQFDAKIANLVEKLGLTPQQEEQLRAHYAGKIEAYEELMAGGFENMRSIEGMEKMAAVIGDADLGTAMEGVLSDEQLGDYEVLKTSERKNGIETTAMKSMASMQGVLNLDDTQKDAVYDILYAEAELKQDKKSPVSSMMSAFGGGMMMNVDTSMIEQRMVIEADESLDADQKKAKVEEMQKASQDAKVSRFDGILTAPQQQQYRQSLESQNRWMRGWGGGRRGR